MNHWNHNVYVDKEPMFCSDCEVYLDDEGGELLVEPDADEPDWTNAPTNAPLAA